MEFPQGSRLWLSASSFSTEDGIWRDLSGNGNDFIFYDGILESEFIIEDILDADLIDG